MITFSDKVKQITMWYANLNGFALPLSPEQLLNAVVAWVEQYGGDHIYFDSNVPDKAVLIYGDILIDSKLWTISYWNGKEWENQGSIAGVAATVEVGEVDTLDPGQQATVENTGTEFAAVLKFGIPKGEKGEQGETGPQGAAGTPGQDGAAASVTVGQTTTLPAGSSATVTNVGTPSAAVLNFGIPRGENGQTGQVVFDIINITGSGTIASDDLAKIASSPEGVALVDENNYRYKISRSDGTNYIFTADNIDSGDIQLYVVTVNSSSGAYTRTSAEASSPVPRFTPLIYDEVSASQNGFYFSPCNMTFGERTYTVESNLPIKPGDGITMDVSSDGRSVLIGVDANEMFTEVELSGSSGTVDDEVLAILQRDTPAVYIKKDGEIYYYSDNTSASGYLVFTHVGMTNSNAYYIKTVTVTISTKAWTSTEFEVPRNEFPFDVVMIRQEEEFDFNTFGPRKYGYCNNAYMPLSYISNGPSDLTGDYGFAVFTQMLALGFYYTQTLFYGNGAIYYRIGSGTNFANVNWHEWKKLLEASY